MDGSRDRLIGALAADLQPVRPLLPPALRTLLWLILVAIVAAVLAMFADVSATWHRLSAVSDTWLAALGCIATMAAAALAAFELSLPDRSRAWALLPLPAAVLWVGASGLGCMGGVLLPGTHVAAPPHGRVHARFDSHERQFTLGCHGRLAEIPCLDDEDCDHVRMSSHLQ